MIGSIERRRLDQNLFPGSMVEQARSLSRSAFAERIAVPLLLVRIDDAVGDGPSDLLRGLEDAQSSGPPSSGAATQRDRIGFSTALDPSELPAPLSSRSKVDRFEVRKRLLLSKFFAQPLRKREVGSKTFTGKVSIGRARNNDIVLRHSSVSKFHAWFEARSVPPDATTKAPERTAWMLADARSKNGTWLGLDALPSGAPIPIAVPCEVRFSRVSALVIDADLLWIALMEG